MVLFITSKTGFQELTNTVLKNEWPIWIGSDVLPDELVKKYRDQGLNITVFNECFAITDSEKIEEAIHTIKEHHPGEHILVERIT